MVLCATFGSLKDWSEARNKFARVIALSVLAGETALGRTGFTRWCARSMPIYRFASSSAFRLFRTGVGIGSD